MIVHQIEVGAPGPVGRIIGGLRGAPGPRARRRQPHPFMALLAASPGDLRGPLAGAQVGRRHGGGAGHQLSPRGAASRAAGAVGQRLRPAAARLARVEEEALSPRLRLMQVMMGFIAEWEPKLGVKIVCSQVRRRWRRAAHRQSVRIERQQARRNSCRGGAGSWRAGLPERARCVGGKAGPAALRARACCQQCHTDPAPAAAGVACLTPHAAARRLTRGPPLLCCCR